MMLYIEQACHAKWKVKQVSSDFMLGVRRTLTHEGDALVLTLTQTEYIDGVIGAYQDQLVAAGWGDKSPETPVPEGKDGYLTLDEYVSEEETKAVSEMGYKGICGSLIWVMRFTHNEIAFAVSMCCRVMSRPSRKAWAFAMQILAWLRDHKTRGKRFRSDYDEHGLVASVDASFKPDPKDGRCQHSHVVQWKGGTLCLFSAKHKHAGFGTPAVEYMAIRWAAARVRGFRNLLEELGLHKVIEQPTLIYIC